MHKDFKVGMLLGLILAMAGILWLSTRPSLAPAPAAEMLNSKPETPNSSLDSRPPLTHDPNDDLRVKSDKSRETRDEERTIKTPRVHIVRQDETLSAISQQYYGSPNKWQRILQANRSQLKDPNRITPGTKLIIPD